MASYDEEFVIFDYRYIGQTIEVLDKVIGDILYGELDIEEGLHQAIQEDMDRISAGG